MSQDRYAVIPPVEGGYAYFNVIDRESPICPNFAVATIHKDAPWADTLANLAAGYLNEYGELTQASRCAENVSPEEAPNHPPTASRE